MNIITANIPSFASFPDIVRSRPRSRRNPQPFPFPDIVRTQPWLCHNLLSLMVLPPRCTVALGAPQGSGSGIAARPGLLARQRRRSRLRHGQVARVRCRRAGGLLAPHLSLGDSFARSDRGELQRSLCLPTHGLECGQEGRRGSIAVACCEWDSYLSSPSLGLMTFFTAAALAVGVRGVEKFGRFVGWSFLRSAGTVVTDAAAQRVGMMWFVAEWFGRGWLNGIKIANVQCTFDMRNTVP
jgi:hypothetical protein